MEKPMNSREQIAAAVIILVLSCIAKAAIVHVPSDQSTIKAAISAATDGDTVLVADGMYIENVQILTKKIVLASEFIFDGNADHILNTIINGSTPSSSDTGSCVIIAGDAASQSAVRGFTITGGNGTRWLDISDGQIYREGGGILIEAENVKIYDNIIANNTATDVSGSSSAGGGGIRCGFGSAEFIHNIIAYNQGRYGSGLVAFHSPVVIKNNVVFANTGSQTYGGAGLWIWGGGFLSTIVNNTIVNNSTTNSGGGISIRDHAVDLVNNVVYGNTAASGFQIYLGSGATVNASYCDVQGGYSGTGNIDQPPSFAATNFLLSNTSPCIDAGNPETTYNDPEDSGNPGFAHSPAKGTVQNDMGAYGGPSAVGFPLFTVPSISVINNPVLFDSIGVGGKDTTAIRLAKAGYGNVIIDSIRFLNHPPATFSAITTLPHFWGLSRGDSVIISWQSQSEENMIDTAFVYHSDPSVSNPIIVELRGKSCCSRPCGDASGDVTVDISDVVYLISYIFSGGPAPQPLIAGDANCDSAVDISDAVYLIAYIFSGGPAPCSGCK
jgi:hypothetical protein